VYFLGVLKADFLFKKNAFLCKVKKKLRTAMIDMQYYCSEFWCVCSQSCNLASVCTKDDFVAFTIGFMVKGVHVNTGIPSLIVPSKSRRLLFSPYFIWCGLGPQKIATIFPPKLLNPPDFRSFW